MIAGKRELMPSRRDTKLPIKNLSRRPSVIELWSRCEDRIGLEKGSRHIGSEIDPFRRVYLSKSWAIKIEFPELMTSARLRRQDIAGEFEIYKKCSMIDGVGQVAKIRREDGFTAMYVERSLGRPVLLDTVSWLDLAKILLKLAVISMKMARIGVAHNDYIYSNILIDANGQITLIDFDQAIETSRTDALMRSFLGKTIKGDVVHVSIFNLIRLKVLSMLPPQLLSKIRLLKNRIIRNKHRKDLPKLPEAASPEQRTMLEAWGLAQLSEANAPGKGLAYYSLDFEGLALPGERPWADRWSVLSGLMDYRGKKVLELGCNMGLLSTFLMRDGGCVDALAVDIDAAILETARSVASAMSVRPEFNRVDFDSDENWELGLLDFKPDIVFALNVLNWVDDKDRFLSFLGQFPCLIFEGHDSFEIEKERLHKIGFEKVDLVCHTERSRPLIVSSK